MVYLEEQETVIAKWLWLVWSSSIPLIHMSSCASHTQYFY